MKINKWSIGGGRRKSSKATGPTHQEDLWKWRVVKGFPWCDYDSTKEETGSQRM